MSSMNDAELRRRLELLADVQPSPQATSRALDRVRQTLTDPNKLPARKSLGRIVMNSKWTKFAVAAAIVVAVLLGLQFLGNPLGSSLTFAQVIQPILNANTAILEIIIGVEDPNTPVIRDMVMGSRIRRTVSGIEGNVSIIDLEAGRILNLDTTKNEAAFIDLKGLPAIPNYLDHLKNVLTTLQDSPHFVTEDLGIQQVDGHEAIGFRAKHPKIDIVLWADARTGLPIRIEQKEGQLSVICKNLQFGVPMDETLFSMEVPEGHTLQQTEIDLLGSTEADFIEGLRILAERYGDSQFPDSVALEDFMKRIPQMQEKEKQFKLSPEEDADLTSKIQKHILFLRFYKGEGKWYYRGQGVKLGEADKAIFWYRPKDSATYRVIYGDLHVEDATPENLPEPLAVDDVVTPVASYQQWSKPEFVGSQEDFWYVLPDGKAQVKAYLTLMKGPKDTSLMPVSLPYAKAPLEAVLLGGPGQPAQDFAALPFHRTGDGTYNIELPIDKLSAGQTMMILQWHLSLDELKFEQGHYITVLQAVIPVISYKLNVGVDPQSEFELTMPPKDRWVTPFTGGAPDGAKTKFGSCGLLVRKRQ
ncbi:MAG: hypothetical protein FJ280_04940 [Planctomycetes bacterium]|nr:hypothetical protein [Planctomycetota bacterium]